MTHMRRITVDGRAYEWKYSFDDYDYQMPSHLTFRSLDKTIKVILNFGMKGRMGYCPFNIGKDAVRDGQTVRINFNEPRFIAEIIHYICTESVGDLQEGMKQINGWEVLDQLRYEFQDE